jgi:phasin family protein
MDEQWQSFTSMFTKLAEDLKLPRVDTEQLIEAHRKNIDALARSAEVASEGAKSVAMKQREIVEEAIRETSAMVRDFELKSPQDAAAKQAEFARKAFEAAVRNTRDVAELVQRSSTDALRTNITWIVTIHDTANIGGPNIDKVDNSQNSQHNHSRYTRGNSRIRRIKWARRKHGVGMGMDTDSGNRAVQNHCR